MATKKKKSKTTTAKKMAKKAAKKPAPKKTAKKAAKKTPTSTKGGKKPAGKQAGAKKTAKKAPAKKAAQKAPAKNTAKRAAKKAPAKKAASSTKASSKASSTSTLVQHVFIAAPPSEVYRALTDPTQHGAVTGTVATGEPIEGGTFTASSGYIHGTFEKLEENKLIVQTWTTTEWPSGAAPSRLEVALEDAGDGTELTMTHSEVPTSQAESYRQGWIDNYWNPLRAHFGKA